MSKVPKQTTPSLIEVQSALEQEEARYQYLFNWVPVGLYLTTSEGQILAANPTLVQMLGYPDRESLQSTNMAEVFANSDERKRWDALIEQEGTVRDFKAQLLRHDGKSLWVRDNAHSVHDSGGQLLYYEGSLEDITEQVRTNDALREISSELENRDRFISLILESIPSSLVVLNRSLRIVSANRNFLEKIRREEQTTLGLKINRVFPHVLLEYTRLDQKMREMFLTGRGGKGGTVAYRAPGLSSRTYYYRLIPIKEKATVENILLLMDDITEREQLREEAQRAERHLASVVDCANDLVISLDHRGHIVTWNRAAERISGLRTEQVIGKSLQKLCAAEQRPVMAEVLQRLLRGESVQNTEVNLLAADGQAEVPIAWSCSPMQNDAGEVVGIVAVGRDLTERHWLEAQLIQSTKMASLGVMAGGIAHELRNPLGIISASAQLLLEQPDDSKLRNEGLQKIYAATQRASLIIENLLKFARPLGERMRDVDVHAVLNEILTLLSHQLVLQQVELRKELQPNLPLVYANPEMLQQVFTNLMLNACNAMLQGGMLVITTLETEEGEVEIRFSDNGCGIPLEHLPKIFDPFFTTMPVGKGTGLGLSISYSIVQQHQGTIEVESQVDIGSTFIVRLPVSMVH